MSERDLVIKGLSRICNKVLHEPRTAVGDVATPCRNPAFYESVLLLCRLAERDKP
jgi:hypothetical protein